MRHQKKSSKRCGLPPALAALAVLGCVLCAGPRANAQAIEEPAVRAASLPIAPRPPSLCPSTRPDFRSGPGSASSPRPRRMSRVQLRAWLVLVAAQHGVALFDARTTRSAVSGYHELDPLLRPFAHSAAIYAVTQVAPVGLDWLATRLATSRHPWLRRLWWVPQAAATAALAWSGTHNLGLQTLPRLPVR